MKIIPFNNRLYIKEIKESEQRVGSIMVPEFSKDRRDLPKFMKVQILGVSQNLSEDLVGSIGMIETGFLEEIRIEEKIFTFCPINYLVCLLQEYKNE